MALLYRAIWEDSRPGLIAAAEQSMVEWLQFKGLGLTQLDEGETSATAEYGLSAPRKVGPASVVLQRASGGGTTASRARLTEDRPSDGERWTTTLTALADGPSGGTLWVDVERVSDDPFRRAPFRSPRLVRDLIRSGTDPRVGHVRLSDDPVPLPAAPLAGLVKNEERRLPLAVFSHDEAGADVTMERARAAQARLAGVVLVVILAPTDVDEFKNRVGSELGVWGGAARLYLPNRGSQGLRPERHRYVAAYRMHKSVDAAGEEFVRLLAATVPATQPPAAFERVWRGLATAAPSSSDREILEVALDENKRLAEEGDRLRGDVEARDFTILDLEIETEDLEAQLNRQAAVYERLLGGDSGTSSALELPVEVETVSEAIAHASALPGVVIHPDAPRDVQKLDDSHTVRAWANATWRALRALDAYAASASSVKGGFWEWCQNPTSPWAWPASQKKLAMSESEQVKDNERLRLARLLPVSSEVSSSGGVEMLAHIKVAEGGGMLAPRIYFYDDTKGNTKRVHVGYIGPHEHMPNTKTN